MNKFDIATQILSNLKLTSDLVNPSECYYLCAQKQNIDELKTNMPQVIWGRRGTGKTTLLKAFLYNVNNVDISPETVAIYINMSQTIPTDIETSITKDADCLSLFIFSNLIQIICIELEKLYNYRSQIFDLTLEDQFITSYDALQEYIDLYHEQIQGENISVESIKSQEIKDEINSSLNVDIGVKNNIISNALGLGKRKSKSSSRSKKIEIKGSIRIPFETSFISRCLNHMVEALNIDLLYICLDEYSEIDKVSEYSVQSKTAQLIKQVFFKNPLYSIKIASIWNRSKLHSKGGVRIEGIEYQQDIFEGPNLDIMFINNNVNIIGYFKELLINTYELNMDISQKERESIYSFIMTDIFNEPSLRHLVCGSQGVSRAFVSLTQQYLRIYLRNNGCVKIGDVYTLIRNQYLEDVYGKIPPEFSAQQAINTYVMTKLRRYFLISKQDYKRCKSILLYLQARGVFMQMPRHLTDISIRNNYKLCIVHYGCYLDALDSFSFRKGRKQLDSDSKLKDNGLFIPDYDLEMFSNPFDYSIEIPKGAENEYYCQTCQQVVNVDNPGLNIHCPKCNGDIQSFIQYYEDISL